MSPTQCCGLLCAWALLASAPAWADEPATSPPGTPSPHVGAHNTPQGLADCPHCRKAGLVPASAAADGVAVPAIALPNLPPRPASPPPTNVEAPPVDTRATLDVDVRQIQLPDTAARPRPRLPSASLSVPSARPRLVVSPSSSNVPGEIMAPRGAEPAAGPSATLTPPATAAAELPRVVEAPPISALDEPVPPLPPPGEIATPVPAPEAPDAASGPRDPSKPIITYLSGAQASDPSPEVVLTRNPAPIDGPPIPPLPDASAPAVPSATVLGPAPAAPAPTNASEYTPPDLADPMVYGRHDHPGTNGFTYLPVMLGDQSPASLRPGLMGLPLSARAIVPGQPPTPPSPFAVQSRRTSALIPWARGFKIADNQSPMPQDRVFYSFNYYNNMNESINRRLGSGVTDMQAYRQLLGIEKTFWRGNASLGLRLPIETLSASSRDAALGGTSTAVGNISVYSKFLLYDNPVSGSLLSGGLAITAPTGPSSFAGSPASTGFHDVQLQPFLGYILRRGDLFLQGFTAIDVPTDNRDVTMWYNDVAVGYFLYRDDNPSALLSAIVPTFEAHLNDPLSHRGALRPGDPAGTPDVLDLTFGSSFILQRRLVATVGCSFPVTGPQPFDVEALALLNFYYGRSGMAPPWPMPPAGR